MMAAPDKDAFCKEKGIDAAMMVEFRDKIFEVKEAAWKWMRERGYDQLP